MEFQFVKRILKIEIAVRSRYQRASHVYSYEVMKLVMKSFKKLLHCRSMPVIVMNVAKTPREQRKRFYKKLLTCVKWFDMI